jgi:hypothetical protein
MEASWEKWQASRGGESAWKPYPPNQIIVEVLLLKRTWNEKSERQDYYPNLMSFSGNLWVLNTDQIMAARAYGILKRIPDVPLEDIKDKSKGEPVAKTIAVAQVLWMIAQLILRWRHPKRPLPSTQLEIMTLAIAGSSLLTALLFWPKPQGIEAPIYIAADSNPSIEELLMISSLRTRSFFSIGSGEDVSFWVPENADWTPFLSRLLDEEAHGYKKWRLMAIGIGAAVFGGLHLFSWNLDFPTWQERLAWRICLGLTTGLPLYEVLLFYLIRPTARRAREGGFFRVSNRFLAVLYASARLFVCVEVVRSLAFQPPGTFVATFAAELPAYG